MTPLKRNLTDLEGREFDLVIVGGGIFGACAAWEASSRGLSVALIERGDFANATSANSFKMVHGGIRYLQHADLPRIRQSMIERRVLLRIAPHLVQPLPIVIPTYGHGMDGREALKAGLMLYDLLAFDRNHGIRDHERRIPSGRLISPSEVMSLFPALQSEGLSGAALFSDAQMYNPPRLALAFLRSAAELGAVLANYVEAKDFLRSGKDVRGVKGLDLISATELDIRGKIVLNAAGPWAESFLERAMAIRLSPKGTYSRDACFVVSKRLPGKYALAVQGRTKDPDALVSRKARHLFIVPWHDYSLIGVWHVVYPGPPDDFSVTEHDLQTFLDEINWAYPSLALKTQDVLIWNAGLVPFGENRPGAVDLSYGKRSRMIDHAKEHHLRGLVTLIGVRYTTARGEAVKAVDLVFEKLCKRPPKSMTAVTPIHGGEIESFNALVRHATEECSSRLAPEVVRALVHNHGSAYKTLFGYLNQTPRLAETIGRSKVTKAEVVAAVRDEMALKLGDVVFRRTDLGTAGDIDEGELQCCAQLMAGELGWSESRRTGEIDEVKSFLAKRSVSTKLNLNLVG
jgi:glycerol-3-phosphate dehydrogenase